VYPGRRARRFTPLAAGIPPELFAYQLPICSLPDPEFLPRIVNFTSTYAWNLTCTHQAAFVGPSVGDASGGSSMDYYEDEPHRAFADQPRGSISGRAVAYIAPVLVAGAMLGGYAYHEHRVAEDLAQQNQQNSAALATTRTQVDDLNAKVNALAAQTAKPAPAPNPPMRKLATSHHPAQPSRWQKMQAQLDAQNKQIEDTRTQIASTQTDLSNTRTELTGSIAHTHDELVLLEKKGERSYYEFDLTKAKTYQREGP